MIASKLRSRLKDLDVAKSIDDIIVGNPHVIEGAKGNKIAIDLGDDYSLILSANHPKNPTLESGKVNWPKVSRIKIINIGIEA